VAVGDVMVVPQPYAIHDGLAVSPRLLRADAADARPTPIRASRGPSSADALVDGLVGLGREVTFDPPSSGWSTRAAWLGIAEMHQLHG